MTDFLLWMGIKILVQAARASRFSQATTGEAYPTSWCRLCTPAVLREFIRATTPNCCCCCCCCNLPVGSTLTKKYVDQTDQTHRKQRPVVVRSLENLTSSCPWRGQSHLPRTQHNMSSVAVGRCFRNGSLFRGVADHETTRCARMKTYGGSVITHKVALPLASGLRSLGIGRHSYVRRTPVGRETCPPTLRRALVCTRLLQDPPAKSTRNACPYGNQPAAPPPPAVKLRNFTHPFSDAQNISCSSSAATNPAVYVIFFALL